MLHPFLKFESEKVDKEFTHVDDLALAQEEMQALVQLIQSKGLDKANLSNQDRESKKQLVNAQARNPTYTKLSPYKLHITLARESYTRQVIADLKTIIINHLHVTAGFKIINLTFYDDEKQTLIDYKRFLYTLMERANANIFPEHCRAFKTILTRYNEHAAKAFGQWQIPETWEIERALEAVCDEESEIDNALTRFSNEDQFTIYIPIKFDLRRVLRLCQDLNTYLSMHHLTPGNASSTEFKIGQFINFRQEHLLKDYKDLFTSPENYDKTRIASREQSSSILSVLLPEMAQCPLYQYLSRQLNIPAPRDPFQSLWDSVNGDAFDKTHALLLGYACSFKNHCFNKGTKSYVAGTIGRFFSCYWVYDHGDAVQRALNRCSQERMGENSLEVLLTNLQLEIGNKKINPRGDFRRILAMVRSHVAVPNDECKFHI
ncbi:MAG: hypothetical protein H0U75_13350 [Legionella sp.]|nr:hypothetical protein [Legionella sp.]